MFTDEYFAFGLLLSGDLKLRKRSQGGWHVEEARRKTRTTTMTTRRRKGLVTDDRGTHLGDWTMGVWTTRLTGT